MIFMRYYDVMCAIDLDERIVYIMIIVVLKLQQRIPTRMMLYNMHRQ